VPSTTTSAAMRRDARTAASEPAPSRPAGGDGGALCPSGEAGLFGAHDPFADFGTTDLLGHGRFGSLLGPFGDLARGLGAGLGGEDALAGGGRYACQSFAMCSRTGPDGKTHTERYANSEVGNQAQGIREAQQAYSNSSTGVDKLGLERQLGDRGRKLVTERNRNSREERCTELFRGMDESGREAFGHDFEAQAHHLPQRPRFNPRALMGADFPAAGALPPDGRWPALALE
jgi:hypothetical protein